MLKQRTGAQLEHVPYKGGGQAMIDVVGGQIPLVFTAVASAQQYVRTGRLVGLGVPGAKRSAVAARRADVPGKRPRRLRRHFVGRHLRPRQDAAARSSRACTRSSPRCCSPPFVKERYATLGIEPVGNTPDQFGAQVRDDLARWAGVVKSANVKLD